MEKRLAKKKEIASSFKHNGFTLVETFVAILLFSLILSIVGGAFVTALRIQRRAFNLQAIEENINFVIEAMTKEIRVSNRIITADTPNCATPATSLEFDHPVNGRIIYSLNGTAIQRSDDGVPSNITSNTIEVTRLNFCVSGAAIDDNQQPRITILASIRSAEISQQTTINIQVTLSQRFLSN